MATKFNGWKADDGSLHPTLEAAIEYERVMRFRDWCERNVCCGGPWTSQMVADAILEEWIVTNKMPLDAVVEGIK